MTATTTTLNPGSGGDKPLVDSLTTVDGAGAPSGAIAQMVKIGHGSASDFKTASDASPLPVVASTVGTHFQPGFDIAAGPGSGGPLRQDPDGNLVARAQVLTDELGYRVNFTNTSLAVSIGTCSFTNGSTAVTGTTTINVWGAQTPYVPIVTTQPVSLATNTPALAARTTAGSIAKAL